MNWLVFGLVLGGGIAVVAYIVGLACACFYADEKYGNPAGLVTCCLGVILFFATVAGLTS